jgi:hypothetical protein
MAISGQQVIRIGLPNESANSDSLYTAFNKAANNFANLFACASPTLTFANGLGTTANANSTTNVVRIENTGVVNIVAGTNITVSEKDANGNVTINSTGGGNGAGGTVTSIGVTSDANIILVTNSPITSSGNIAITLANTGVTPGNYTYPTMQVDQYGRVVTISNAASVGTVTSVGLVASGTGLLISGGPITSAGNITITNTGVTRLSAGTGISLSGSTGNITISSTTTGGTVTSVGVSSNTLTITNPTITTTGTINIESPIGSSSENLASGSAANLSVTASYFTTTGGSTATLAAGSTGQIKTFMMVADGGDMVITVTNAGWKTSGTGTITFGDIGDGCTLQYINSKWFCIGQNGVVFA